MTDHTPRTGRLTAHSPRELQAWLTCPRWWAWLYPGEHRHEMPMGAAAERGIAVHEAIAEGRAVCPRSATALKLMPEGARREVQLERGALMGRIDALTEEAVIDWKTVEHTAEDHDESAFSGRRPGLQGEVYALLADVRRAQVVELDQYGEWESAQEDYGETVAGEYGPEWRRTYSAQLVAALVGVEWSWEHTPPVPVGTIDSKLEAARRRAVSESKAVGVRCAQCAGCPAAAECKRGSMPQDIMQMWNELSQEAKQRVLVAFGATSFEAVLETTKNKDMIPAMLAHAAAVPTAPAKKAKTAKAPAAEDAIEQARRQPEAPITPADIQRPVACTRCGAPVQADRVTWATPVCRACTKAQAAEMTLAAVAKATAPVAVACTMCGKPVEADRAAWETPECHACTKAKADALFAERAALEAARAAEAPKAPEAVGGSRAALVAALAAQLVTVPRAEWPALPQWAVEAVGDRIAAERRKAWATADAAARVGLLEAGLVPCNDEMVRQVLSMSPDVNVLARLAVVLGA